jgi:alpha-amylase/alpha-mannosidase (GH57 family)
MLEYSKPDDRAGRRAPGQAYLCLHGHFYQPPRENPFTDQIPLEPAATPFANFNEKITAECYAPNAEAGNFDALNFDLGPTLATWLARAHPEVLNRVIEADRAHVAHYGTGNAMAQAYNHTILPLATTRDKHTQIAWGLCDFRHRYGREATGMWLAETAVDLESLDLLAQHGITYTVLAPWQAAAPLDPSEPYRVRLFGGRSITVFFYNAPLSGGVSFDWNTTSNADLFAANYLPAQLQQSKREADQAQLILIATDGELYGHHRPWRDKFLSHLINVGAPASGFEICTLERYMQMFPATHEVELRLPSAWSCSHGIARWESGCECTEGESSWKGPLRQALANLSAHGDRLFEMETASVLHDPWAARDAYLSVRNGWEAHEHFWARFGKAQPSPADEQRTLQLLEAQYYQQYSFTSCGFFFEDLDRIEPRNDIGFARRALSLYWQTLGVDLQQDFLRDLAAARSWRSVLTGADVYRQLPVVPAALLPPLPGDDTHTRAT